jgi:hypothetical protein
MSDIQTVTMILLDCTREYRKGEQVARKVVGAVEYVDIYNMPHIAEAELGLKLVDVHFMMIGVRMDLAEPHKGTLAAILDRWPGKGHTLASGPSYILVGETLGDQGLALRLFGLGEALGFWKVITPKTLGATGEAADDLAGRGYVMISGYGGGSP